MVVNERGDCLFAVFVQNKALCNLGKVPPGASSLWRRDHSVPVSVQSCKKNVFFFMLTKPRPVYVGDVARAVEICCRDDPVVVGQVAGRIIEAGGPDILTYREIMELVLRYTNLQGRRAIISLPYWVGSVQGFVLEMLPETMFTLTRDQVTQLREDNIVSPHPPMFGQNFEDLLKAFPSSAPSSAPPGDAGLKSVYDILPTYLGVGKREEGKRTHGRKSPQRD